jgi:hypothetical protein
MQSYDVSLKLRGAEEKGHGGGFVHLAEKPVNAEVNLLFLPLGAGRGRPAGQPKFLV